ncbi:hypothetical protein KI387_037278, partial [Taxus chinensis]
WSETVGQQRDARKQSEEDQHRHNRPARDTETSRHPRQARQNTRSRSGPSPAQTPQPWL